MNKLNYLAIMLFLVGMTVNTKAHSQDIPATLFGNYTGEVNAVITLFSIDETFDGLTIELRQTATDYRLVIAEIDLGDGNIMPEYELEDITITPSGVGYQLSKSGSLNIIIPEIIIPPMPPYFPDGATLTDVPAAITLENGYIENNVLTLEVKAVLTLGFIPVPINIYFEGTKSVVIINTEIWTAADLKALADFVNEGNGNLTAGVDFILMSDIDLSDYADGNGWEAIGKNPYENPNLVFEGNFDGNGKKITGLKISSTLFEVGLFGYVVNATIENLGIENCDIEGLLNLGGLVGYIENSTIKNCYVTGNISGSDWVGLIAGNVNNDCLIENCYAIGNLTGIATAGGWLGGIAGSNGNSVISSCYADVEIIVPWGSCGGITAINSGIIKNCYAKGNVTGNYNVGGLVGEHNNYGTTLAIENCYAAVNVTGFENVGGLAGIVYNNAVIKNCVAANPSVIATSGTNFINRITSSDFDSPNAFINNYALETMIIEANGTPVTITPNLNGIEGANATLAQLQSLAFYNTVSNWNQTVWDINDPTGVWNICDTKTLPFLRWQNVDCNENIETISQNGGLQIYPNPTSGKFSVVGYQMSDVGAYNIRPIEILDITGRIVHREPFIVNRATVEIDISHLSSGIYFVKVGNEIVKIVVVSD
ncbi:MAG: T9SS type A sorting domain-containing protein [Marinilabiliaceae bacterium]|nr:T9SS type A sorting domain-containing protein [Marinilabiliaceae bacterium]